MKKIGIIDADLLDNGTRHPNLALMKLSGYFKDRGEDVFLLEDYEDIKDFYRVYISKVFSYTKTLINLKEFRNVRTGGTGFYPDGWISLPDQIEHHKPDYDLYNNYINKRVASGINPKKFQDYLNFSIGFTTRGCFRHCDFCVNRKYSAIVSHSPIEEFLDKDRFGIYLWDDNFLGYSGWEIILDSLIATGKPFQFRQGLDIRLLTEKKAEKLSNAKYFGDYIFAFDNIDDAPLIENKLKLWRKHTNKNTKLFVLCGYKSLNEIDIRDTFERIQILMKYSCVPYIMRYEDYKKSEFRSVYVQLARWCNQPQFFKKMSFREYCVANQEYAKKTHKISRGSSAYYSMIDFEKRFPEIANRYFDLKFEDYRKF